MTPDRVAGIAALDAIVEPLAAAQPLITRARMFGGPGWRYGSRFFAFCGMGGDLLVKLPDDEVAARIAAGTAQPLVMRERTMREWARIPLDRGDAAWREAVDGALAFARSLA